MEPSRPFVAETRFTGAIVWCEWPTDVVAGMLPRSLRLVDGASVDGVHHPVVFMFGEQHDAKVFYASLAFPTGVRFLEFTIAVPFVHPVDDGPPAMFLPRVFSGEPVVTLSGRAHYGFAKRMVPMEWLGSTFVVSDESGALLAHATIESRGSWQRPAHAEAAGLADLIQLGRLPVVGTRADGVLVESHFDWDVSDASVRPVAATISIDAPLGRGIGTVQSYARAHRSCEVAGMRWRLTWPETREN